MCEIATLIGLVHHVRAEEERLSTHLFECTLPITVAGSGTATLSRALLPRGNVCGSLLPGDDALIAPGQVPWADRVRRKMEENAAQERTQNLMQLLRNLLGR